MAQSLPRHIIWRKNYHEYRYCKFLSEAELKQRIGDIVLNMLILNYEAKISLPDLNKNGDVWLQKWTHVLEEMSLRYIPYPEGFEGVFTPKTFPQLAGDLAAKAVAILKNKALQPAQTFIKYGKPKHMTDLYERGLMRLTPASFYKISSHNSAIRDDELSLPFSFTLNRDQITKLVQNPSDVPEGAEQRMDVNYETTQDYWIYCVTQSVGPRLFVNFDSYACVIIRDKQAFKDRLRAVSNSVMQEANLHDGYAIYIDPLLPSTTNINIPLAKHFRYEYQEEYRFILQPKIHDTELSPVDIEIGSLKDIAELVLI